VFRLKERMGLADVLIFAFAAIVDLAVLYSLRRYRRWKRQRPTERIARSLTFALRSGAVLRSAQHPS
jgi:hypothetical protein